MTPKMNLGPPPIYLHILNMCLNTFEHAYTYAHKTHIHIRRIKRIIVADVKSNFSKLGVVAQAFGTWRQGCSRGPSLAILVRPHCYK